MKTIQKIVFSFLLFTLWGCAYKGAKVVEGTDLAVGINMPVMDGAGQLQLFNYLSGFRLGVAENARLTVAYKVAEKNSYLGGCLTTDIKKEIEATVEPCETKAEEDDGEASAREPKDKSEEPPPDSVAAGAE